MPTKKVFDIFVCIYGVINRKFNLKKNLVEVIPILMPKENLDKIYRVLVQRSAKQ